MTKKLLASSGSLDGLRRLIDVYLCGCAVLILHADGRIENGKGVLSSVAWECRRGRYRFYRLT